MRTDPSILHVDLDAFFAAVEQRDKPSLRGKPVVVGGIGLRGVVSTASYEARKYGVRSAMSTAEARSRCPHAAYLGARFDVYRATSTAVMAQMRALSPLVETLSLDEAFVDLAAAGLSNLTVEDVEAIAEDLKDAIKEASGGLTASVGAGTSKLIAKIASDLDKPDGVVVVPSGTEADFLAPMQVTVIPGVGPATAQRLSMAGVRTVADLQQLSEEELVRQVGSAHGTSLYRLATASDDRAVVSDRETKSVSVEDTFDTDIVDRALLAAIGDRMAQRVSERLQKAQLSGRTVTVKTRMHDFTTHTRSSTLAGPTDDARVIARVARRLLEDSDISGGIRLLGVGVSSLADWIQDDLFVDSEDEEPAIEVVDIPEQPRAIGRAGYYPGQDVVHTEHGDGWVWGSGLGRVTVRFETAETPPGPVRTFAVDDPALVTLASLHEAEELAEAEELREADELRAGAPEADEAALIQDTSSAAGRIGR
ncbi:MAG TPA: DNA polymerase IV [Kribbella sp.]